MAAARVGGIFANNTFKGQFLYENLVIQNNIIHYAHKVGVRKLLFLGSACIYPKFANQPIKEEALLTGELEPTNEPYAIAKIAGIKLCQSYFEEYNENFISVMPNNLYGENDNFDLKTSHVVPALIRKMHSAKKNAKKDVEIWGSGDPLREFLHVDDLADAVVFLMINLEAKELYKMDIAHVNIGSGNELSIRQLAILISKIVGFKGNLIFNNNMLDGTMRKVLDTSVLNSLGWKPKIGLNDGLNRVYSWYKKYYCEKI